MKNVIQFFAAALVCFLSANMAQATASATFPEFKAPPWCGCKGAVKPHSISDPAPYPDFASNTVKTTKPPTLKELDWLYGLLVLNTDPERNDYIKTHLVNISYEHMADSLNLAAKHCQDRATSNRTKDPTLPQIKIEESYMPILTAAAKDCHSLPNYEETIKETEEQLLNCQWTGPEKCKELENNLKSYTITADAMRKNCATNFSELFKDPPLLHTR